MHDLHRPRTGLTPWALFLLLCITPALGSPIISEFLAINRDSIKDSDGDRSDWIEIRNSSSSALNLAGYSLTDDASTPAKWVFPNTTLPGGGYLIVFASGKDRRIAGSELHTNFSLTSVGEYLALFAPGAVEPETAFAPYPTQLENVSYGEGGSSATTTAISTRAACRWRVPTSTISNWNSRTFNDSSWSSGSTGVGYENSPSNTYDSLIGPGSNTISQMFNLRTSAYIRIPFNLTGAHTVSQMTLKMKYDDGFAAFINGQTIASDRAPNVLNFNSIATASHDDADALVFSNFVISDLPDNLINGQNVLAIQGLNRTTDSSNFIILPELEITKGTPQPDLIGFHPVATPNATNNQSFDGLVEDTKFSIKRGFFVLPFNVAITTATPDAQIRYTTDGSAPTATAGSLYSGPVRVSTTTVLRAAAFKTGFAPTNVDTQTYLFTNSVRTQPAMDTAITNSGTYSNLMDTALRGNIPIVSLATPDAGFFGSAGIYTNSEDSGRAAEVPVSVEYFTPTGSEQFQIDAGIRIHGGDARSHPKKPLRLYFRRDYGEPKLRYPLFPGSPVEEFDQLLLRGGGHDSWSLASSFGRSNLDLPPHGTIMRDQFLRRTELEMGILSPRGKYVHVYINGSYWGVYDLHERANEDFFADHGGGQPEDYDVLHHPETFLEDYSLVSGTETAWDNMQALASAGINSESQYQAIQQYLDVDSFIVALITRMWSGDYDWCGPILIDGVDRTFFGNKNWYAGRRSRNGDGKFKFFCWDGEMSMGLHLMFNLDLGVDLSQRVTNFDLTQADDSGSPVALYDRLRQYREFRVRFSDLLQKHLFNEGVMSTANNRARLSAMENEIENAMIAESARWGDEGGSANIFDRNGDWLPEVNWLKDTFIGERNALLISQFRSAGVFPSLNAPTFSARSGTVAEDSSLFLSGNGGTIYYTTDGSDPRLAGGEISPSAQLYFGIAIPLQRPSTIVRARIRATFTNWSALDEATFIVGQPASADNLVITEIHYHPANPSTSAELAASRDDADFEFIEIANTSDVDVTLTNIQFTQGLSFAIGTDAPIQEIGAGQRLVIVSNRDAFLARYGQSLAPLILGTFADGSKLSNNGESITLTDASGQIITSFTYSDAPPWPSAADGMGLSLELLEPITSSDPAEATSWTASPIPHGTPGSRAVDGYESWAAIFFDPSAPDFGTVSSPTADPDNDGWDNLTEYALGQPPHRAGTRNPIVPGSVTSLDRDFATISYTYQPAFEDVSISVESSRDLGNWTSASVVTEGVPVEQPDGTVFVTFRLTAELDRSSPMFLRLRIESGQP